MSNGNGNKPGNLVLELSTNITVPTVQIDEEFYPMNIDMGMGQVIAIQESSNRINELMNLKKRTPEQIAEMEQRLLDLIEQILPEASREHFQKLNVLSQFQIVLVFNKQVEAYLPNVQRESGPQSQDSNDSTAVPSRSGPKRLTG